MPFFQSNSNNTPPSIPSQPLPHRNLQHPLTQLHPLAIPICTTHNRRRSKNVRFAGLEAYDLLKEPHSFSTVAIIENRNMPSQDAEPLGARKAMDYGHGTEIYETGRDSGFLGGDYYADAVVALLADHAEEGVG